MSLAAVAVLPSAPLLLPGVAASLPDGAGAVCDAVDAVVERLPDHDTVVVVAADETWGVHARARADLTPIGRPDIARSLTVDRALVDALAGDFDWPVLSGDLPLDHAILALLLGAPAPLVALRVPAGAPFDVLAAAGARLHEALEARDEPAVVVAAGDLAAGLGERAPLHVVEGASEFDGCVVDAVDHARLDVLARLGPDEARRVGARGWAPLALLHGALERSKLGLVRRLYAAPRGVGYLVAYGA